MSYMCRHLLFNTRSMKCVMSRVACFVTFFLLGSLVHNCDGLCKRSFNVYPSMRLQSLASRRTSLLSLRGGDDCMELDSVSMTGPNATNASSPPTVIDIFVKWKLETLELSVNLDYPVDVLKSQLYTMTNVKPDAQHLLGVYTPGAGADLKDLDLKPGQTLIMYGEPSRVKEEDDLDVEMSAEKRIPANTYKSFIHKTALGDPLAEMIDKMSIEEIMGEGKDARTVVKLTTLEQNEISVAMKDAFTSQISVPHETPLTLPKELWSKRLQDFTDEDRVLLRNWMNLTRNWRIATKEYAARAEEMKRNVTKQQQEEEAEKRLNEIENEIEEECQAVGLSYRKAQELVEEGTRVIVETDFLTNDETFQKYKHLMDPPGLNFDDAPFFKNFTDNYRKYAIRAWAASAREAVLDSIEQAKIDKERNAQVAREYEENKGQSYACFCC